MSWSVLRRKGMRSYFLGSLASNLGTWVQNTAQMLLAYQLTHSALAVGAIMAAQFAWLLVLGPWAGNLAYRLGPKRVLITSQLMSAVIAGSMAIVQLCARLTEWDLLLGALGTGLALTFALPVQNALVPALVPEQDRQAALAMNSVSYNAGRALAPALYLAVLTVTGAGWAYALNAVSFLVFAITIVAIHPGQAARPDTSAADWSVLRVAIRKPRIILLLAMVAAVTIADDPVQILGPPLAHDVLRVSGIWPAYFLSALGLGTIVGSLVQPRRPTSRHAGAGLGLLAISVLAFVAGYRPWSSLVAAVAAGIAALLTGAAAQALLLKEANQVLHATQVMALWAVAWAGVKPIASIADGWLASTLDVRWAATILVLPAASLAILELFARDRRKNMAKDLRRPSNETQGVT